MRSDALFPVDRMRRHLAQARADLIAAGLARVERPIDSAQGASVLLPEGSVINLCSNNYLGLANHSVLLNAARHALQRYGLGMASVRFICGTHVLHRELEQRLAAFLGTQDAILFSSCFDANTGVFEALLDDRDAVVSDTLNHASIIDGIRLSKARRLRYANGDMEELEECLQATATARFRLIVTDGVFSMDGTFANLPAICTLAHRYDAIVMVDDSHAVGFVGPQGRGTPAHFGLHHDVALLTGTFGKALGGAAGGYAAGPRELIDWLRQRARTYVFSNALPPMITAAATAALAVVQSADDLRDRLWHNARLLRGMLQEQGFELVPGEHPIIPVMLQDAQVTQAMAERLRGAGVFVTPIAFPVVPKGKARIRVQVSAAHSEVDLARAAKAFASCKA